MGKAEDDQFSKGQPQKVRDALGARATFVSLSAEDSTGNHCHVGSQALLN